MPCCGRPDQNLRHSPALRFVDSEDMVLIRTGRRDIPFFRTHPTTLLVSSDFARPCGDRLRGPTRSPHPNTNTVSHHGRQLVAGNSPSWGIRSLDIPGPYSPQTDTSATTCTGHAPL